MTPYFADETVTLFLGDCREVLPALGLKADCVIADPPYESTSLEWDKWPDGWLKAVAPVTRSLWCFGSMRMFGEHWGEFAAAGWKFSQDIVWEKNAGSGPSADRFPRVHEHALHWYRGPWAPLRHVVPLVAAAAGQIARNGPAVRMHAAAHRGEYGQRKGWTETGTRLMRSVIKVRSMRGQAIHRTEKPIAIVTPLIEYACPPGGLVIAPFAGSGSDLVAARATGRRAIGVEVDERCCELAACRLAQGVLT